MNVTGQFKQRLLARERLSGTFLNLGSPVTVEMAGLAGFDWLLIDHEHGPGGEETLLHQLQAASATPAVPIVRVAANETARFKRVLDAGAAGVMVPWVSNEAEARAAVAAMRYPPHGIRGTAKLHRGCEFGATFADYYAQSHEWLVMMAQIETVEGVRQAERIAAVDGVDVLFIGPMDLTTSMGIQDQLTHPAFREAVRFITQAAEKAGKASGILLHNAALLPLCLEFGISVIALGSDGGLVASGLRSAATAIRDLPRGA